MSSRVGNTVELKPTLTVRTAGGAEISAQRLNSTTRARVYRMDLGGNETTVTVAGLWDDAAVLAAVAEFHSTMERERR